MSKKLYLLDAYALIYRGYCPFLNRPRLTLQGDDTSAVVGFLNTFDDILSRVGDDGYMAVVFDPPAPTFRHKMYPEYKAQRERTPEAISYAIPFIKKIIEARGVRMFVVNGYEADDVIGTIAHRVADKHTEMEVYMITPDKDYGQLVTDRIHILRPLKGGEYQELGPKEVAELHDLNNSGQVIDYLALMGDASDNIPGVPKVGKKTAAQLLQRFATIEGIYDHIDDVPGKVVKDNLLMYREQLMHSRELVKIVLDVPVDFQLEDLRMHPADYGVLSEIYTQLELNSKLSKLHSEIEVSSVKPRERSLFDLPIPEANTVKTMRDLENTPHDYKLLDDPKAIEALAVRLEQSVAFAFDTETEGLNPLVDPIVGISFAIRPHEAWYLPLSPIQVEATEQLRPFRKLFQNKEVLKVGQNLKFDLKILSRYGVISQGPYWDTMIAHYLINPEQRHGLDYVAQAYLGYKPMPIEDLIGTRGKKQLTMGQINSEKVLPYAAEDADVTLRLYEALKPEIEANDDLRRLFYDMEMPLMEVLLKMEQEGVKLDALLLKNVVAEMEDNLGTLEQEIHNCAGEPFNIGSPKEVGEVLFDHLKLVEKPAKTPSGQYRTNEETLEKISDLHPIIKMILDYRGQRKLLNTYVEPLPQYISPFDGRLHTTFNQTVTATGRLSSSDPNLQNIPVRDEAGRQVRMAFTGHHPEEGDLFVSADYSQIELRIMAHLSGDKNLIRAFNEGLDIHAATAGHIYGVNPEAVTPEYRRRAKTANFGIIYGISAYGLSSRLAIPRAEASDLIKSYFESFPAVKDYMDEAISKASSLGYVETLFGRRRYLPNIHSQNANVRGAAERNAINAPIQGTAADIIKLAMIRVQDRLEKEHLRARMILQVHDELCFTSPSDEVETLVTLIRSEMEGVMPQLQVPLIVDVGVGKNWLEAH